MEEEEEDLKRASAPMILYTNNFICKTQVPYKHFVAWSISNKIQISMLVLKKALFNAWLL